jgi:hypothetical protein
MLAGTDIAVSVKGSFKTITRVNIDLNASGDNEIIAAVASKKHYITHLEIQNPTTTSNTILMKDGATAINGDGYVLPGLGAFYLFKDFLNPIVLSTNTAFNLNLSASQQISGFVEYYTE